MYFSSMQSSHWTVYPRASGKKHFKSISCLWIHFICICHNPAVIHGYDIITTNAFFTVITTLFFFHEVYSLQFVSLRTNCVKFEGRNTFNVKTTFVFIVFYFLCDDAFYLKITWTYSQITLFSSAAIFSHKKFCFKSASYTLRFPSHGFFCGISVFLAWDKKLNQFHAFFTSVFGWCFFIFQTIVHMWCFQAFFVFIFYKEAYGKMPE